MDKLLKYKIDSTNLVIHNHIESNGFVSVVQANDGRFYIFNEVEKVFCYPSDSKDSVLKMYYDIIVE